MTILNEQAMRYALEQFGFHPDSILLSDHTYQVVPPAEFEPTRWEKVKGLKIRGWRLGGADCGKLAIRYMAELNERYAEKYIRSRLDLPELPALPVGLVCYREDRGGLHLVLGGIVATAKG